MATGLSTKLTGQIGEHLVTAELGRLGIIATPFSGNVPEIDILAHANGITGHIQVKAINADSWQFDIRKFLNVVLERGEQKVLGINEDLDKSIICVFVALGDIIGKDEFYIFRQKVLQNIVFNNHSKALKKWKGIRPRNPDSLHSAYDLSDIDEYRDNWKLIVDELK